MLSPRMILALEMVEKGVGFLLLMIKSYLLIMLIPEVI